jgi:hypothetical protein
MAPTYTFEEMRELIRKSDCEKDLSVIAFVLRLEGKRYPLTQIQALARRFREARFKISLK